MKALVFEGPGQKSWTDVPDPSVQNATDAIVRVDTTTICGTDLHILKGDVPAVQSGRILGHEGVGTVVATGSSVTGLRAGERVIISCIKSCGHCNSCKTGLYSHCQGEEGAPGIGWIFGHLIDGTQAEYVRVPYADNSLHKLPEGVTDEQAVMLSDILPTGFEIGVQYGRVKPGDTVVVVGAGPVGLAAIATAGLYGAASVIAIDVDEHRLQQARDFGATSAISSQASDWKDQVFALTEGHGADVAIEAVGIPETFEMAVELVRPGGNVANVGVHGRPVELHLENLWIQNINISMGLVNANTTPTLLKLVAQHRIPAEKFATHHFQLTEIVDAYDTFSRAAATKALKVVLTQ